MIDDLIARLSTDLKPTHRMAMQRMLFGQAVIGCILAAGGMSFWFGLRPDLAAASASMTFWAKFAFTLGLAVLGGVATVSLARPDGRTILPWLLVFAALVFLVLLGVVQLTSARPEDAMSLTLGQSAIACPWRIAVLSLPVLSAAFLGLRKLAPRDPTLAGFAAGIMAGGAGAWVYSFACIEDGLIFVALFYTLGIMMVGIVGAVLGRIVLRW